jgi:hypothetical protein
MHPKLLAAITIGAFLIPLSASARVREQGNLPYPYYQGIHQMWASQNISRDTVFAVLDDGTVYHYGPVTDGNGQKTYWWLGGYSVGYGWSRIAP